MALDASSLYLRGAAERSECNRWVDGRTRFGEAEAIILAKELGADLLLVDERKGRIAAGRFGLRSTGLLGVLVEAKKAGLLDRLEPILDDLTDRVGFRVSAALKAEFLKLAGES